MSERAAKAKPGSGPGSEGGAPPENLPPAGPADKALITRAQRFLEETRRLFEKHRAKVSSEHKEKLEAAISQLEAALADPSDAKRLTGALRDLDAKVEQGLGFAKKSTTREYSESIIIAVVIALFLRAFVVEAFKIPTGSMIPTLAIGDHIFANKFVYGLRVPFTNRWFAQWGTPARGDVIVFRFPRDMSKDYIKRVVGVAGDRIHVQGTEVSVNGARLERRPPSDFAYIDEGEDAPMENVLRRVRAFPESTFREADAEPALEYTVLYEDFDPERLNVPREEQLPGLDCQPGDGTNPGVCTVRDGYLFVMGDNRDNSSDSRVWGCVPTAFVKGKAMFVWWSRGPQSGVRWDRIGKMVH